MPATDDISLAQGTQADIPFIMSTERLDGYDEFVGRWDEARHRSALLDDRHAYFVARNSVEPIGFAILRDWASPEQVTLVKRIAVCKPGRGHGAALLRALIGLVFERTNTHRLYLGVFPENLRARRAYEKVGFVAEGIARGSAFFGGFHRDEMIMSILRPEWIAQNSLQSRGAELNDSFPA